MKTDTANARPKRKVTGPLLAAVALLTAMGSAALYLLGREDPNDPALSQLDWGNRLERRLDAIIDKNRPEWADRVESQAETVADTIGFK